MSIVPFTPKLRFNYPNARQSWFPGHMTAFMNDMARVLPDVDMIIECRDARLPLTSINPQLEDIVDNAWGKDWKSKENFGVDTNGVKMVAPPEGVERKRARKKLVVYLKRDLAEERMEQVRSHPALRFDLTASVCGPLIVGIRILMNNGGSPSSGRLERIFEQEVEQGNEQRVPLPITALLLSDRGFLSGFTDMQRNLLGLVQSRQSA